MIIFFLLFSLFLITISNAYPMCKSINTNEFVLNTLNGRIQGTCYDVTVNYALKRPETKQVISWLSIKKEIINLNF
jgi:hypothetical protein